MCFGIAIHTCDLFYSVDMCSIVQWRVLIPPHSLYCNRFRFPFTELQRLIIQFPLYYDYDKWDFCELSIICIQVRWRSMESSARPYNNRQITVRPKYLTIIESKYWYALISLLSVVPLRRRLWHVLHQTEWVLISWIHFYAKPIFCPLFFKSNILCKQ